MPQTAKQPKTDVEIARVIDEEDDDRAAALEQGQEDREGEDVNQAARNNAVKVNYPRG
jgi:hypothetical protein